MDILFPASFNFSRVNWKAKLEHEYVPNYKILQEAFKKNNCTKHIEARE